jgi:ABC-2 type transport system ATP-binding protein
MFAVETNHLRKTYKVGFWRKQEKIGVRDLNLEVREGEVFGCLGPNGAGKSTTLKMLMGLTFPTGGTAKILGRDVNDPDVKAQIGFLPEQPYFYDHLTASELLHYYAQLSGVSAAERSQRVPQMLERVGLAEAADTQLRKFSKGMLQRVGIAQAIIHDPKIVFLDEPMSGLDPVGRREVRDLMASLHDEGKTIFFSTHILSDAEALCDRVAVLNKGELRGVGVVAELLAQQRGKIEVTWQSALEIEPLKQTAEGYRVAGATSRAVFREADTFKVVSAIEAAGGRLVAINPVRASLEEYFLEKVHSPREPEVARA